MSLVWLPKDIILMLLNRYLNIKDAIAISMTCKTYYAYMSPVDRIQRWVQYAFNVRLSKAYKQSIQRVEDASRDPLRYKYHNVCKSNIRLGRLQNHIRFKCHGTCRGCGYSVQLHGGQICAKRRIPCLYCGNTGYVWQIAPWRCLTYEESIPLFGLQCQRCHVVLYQHSMDKANCGAISDRRLLCCGVMCTKCINYFL